MYPTLRDIEPYYVFHVFIDAIVFFVLSRVRNISSKFCDNSKADASELSQNLEEMFQRKA